MRYSVGASTPIVLWHGFRHRWQYNHRANRVGSYIEYGLRPNSSYEIEAAHTAASGTGPDRAEFTNVFTMVRARGVGFQPGVCEVELVTTEERLASFKLLQRVELKPQLTGKETYAVVLGGFDLCAEGDAKKLMTLVLGVTDPELDASRSVLSFSTYGAFRVDCSSGECDRIMSEMREQEDGRWRTSVAELDQKIAYDLKDPKRTVEAEVGKRCVLEDRGPPLVDQVHYVLYVHYLIIAGNDENVHIAHTEPVSYSYTWDRRTELSSTLADREPLHVRPIEGKPGFEGFTFAFKQIIMTLYRKGIERRIFWRKDIAMHFLEWNMAIYDTKELEGDRFTCTLDLFFKNWRKYMRWCRLPFSIFAYRDAGEAQFGAQLTLMQFKGVDVLQPGTHDGCIHWCGGNREAMGNPASIYKRRLCIAQG